MQQKRTVLWTADERMAEEGTVDTQWATRHAPWSGRVSHRILPAANMLDEATSMLRQQGLVAFPTETVYGLGASALDRRALRAVFAAKNRPLDNPLIAHVSRFDQIEQIGQNISELALQLMQRFWPGPLSILVQASKWAPVELTAGLPQVAVRMPNHPHALALIEELGKPIAAPSANVSGRPSPTTAVHVLQDLAGRIDGVIDGGACQIGIESTVVTVEDEGIVILRPGGIGREDLASLGCEVIYDPHLESLDSMGAPRAPGQKYRHYAPNAPLHVVHGQNTESIVAYIGQELAEARNRGLRTGLLTLTEMAQMDADYVFALTATSTPEAIAHRLYGALRAFDEAQVDVIFAVGVPDTEPYRAIMNRMYKAAGGNLYRV